MFTAAKVIERIEESDNIDGLDKWIENYLCKKFVENDGKSLSLQPSQTKQQGWKRNAFMNAMKERGFIIQFYSDQRDGEYYVISLPVQPSNKESV